MKKNRFKGGGGYARFNRIGPGANALFNALLFALAALCIVPMLLVLAISLSPEQEILRSGYRFFPRRISLEGCAFVIRQGGTILRALGMSVFVTVSGTVIGVTLNSLMGYVLSRRRYRLRGFFTWLVFIPMVFNGGLVATYFVTAQFLGLKDSVWALILPLSVSSFSVIVCKTFFRISIPDSLIESAVIDGASQLRIYASIVLPLSLPVLATVGLFLSFAYWNDWFQAMLYIDNTSLFTLQAYLNRLLGDINFLAQNAASLGASQAELLAAMPKEAARMAIVVIAVLPAACVYPFFQKYFVAGLTVGAVKG
ncbi:MAG: carbohydrate ABC transporter permease [Treponema sp.]|jgi:putative aldouronate transport system permease protein|nr:carbohydrate ABC transporter permease [Treponema sp.]